MVLYFLKSGLGVLNPHVLIRGFLLYVENGCYNSKCYNKNHVRVTWKFLGGGGSSKSPLERKFLRGGGMQTKNLPWEGYGYFLEPHNLLLRGNKMLEIYAVSFCLNNFKTLMIYFV